MKHLRYRKRKYFSPLKVTVITILLFPLIVSAINTNTTGYKIEAGKSKKIDAHGVCKNVDNNSNVTTNPVTIFVPTNAEQEWTLFRENHPSYISLSDCAAVVVKKPTPSSGLDIYWHHYRSADTPLFWERN